MYEGNKERGKLIVLYGNNNIGKSTQAKLLTEKLKEAGVPVRYMKYPVYDLVPSGPMINAYLRDNNPHGLSTREVQILYALNRTQYEPELKELLEGGTTVVAEDYTGTGIAWGLSGGATKEFLLEVNSHLLKEDIAICMHGERYLVGKEEGHVHETDDERLQLMQQIFVDLSDELGWEKVSANGSVPEVQARIWNTVAARFPGLDSVASE